MVEIAEREGHFGQKRALAKQAGKQLEKHYGGFQIWVRVQHLFEWDVQASGLKTDTYHPWVVPSVCTSKINILCLYLECMGK